MDSILGSTNLTKMAKKKKRGYICVCTAANVDALMAEQPVRAPRMRSSHRAPVQIPTQDKFSSTPNMALHGVHSVALKEYLHQVALVGRRPSNNHF